MLGIPSPDPNGGWELTRTLGGGVVPVATAPGRCCSFGIPGEEVEVYSGEPAEAFVGSEQTGNPESWEGSQDREAETGSAPLSQAAAPAGLPSCATPPFPGCLLEGPGCSLAASHQPPPRWPWSLGYVLYFQASTTPLDCLPRRTIVHENSLPAPANP